jgi:hypothetical protein
MVLGDGVSGLVGMMKWKKIYSRISMNVLTVMEQEK